MPPVPSSLKRMTANPSRPARHRPGKAIPEEESSEEEEEEEEVEAPRAPTKAKQQARPSGPTQVQAAAHENEGDTDDGDEDGFVTEDEDNVPARVPSSTAAKAAPKVQTATKPVLPSGPVPSRSLIPQATPVSKGETSEDEASISASSSEDESESGSDLSSSPEPPQRKLLRPTFIKKTDRKTPLEPASNTNQTSAETFNRTSATPGPSVISATTLNTQDDAARRLGEAENLIKQRIERDTIARLQGRKNWDDDDDLPPEALVDDTDGLDPAAEHSAWRLREMHRLKRDREALIAREKEIEEVERRRGLTAEEREKEDRAHLDQQKAAKDSREQAGYLAKYHHKGAFFMDEDDEAAKRLRERQFAGARFEDEVVDKSTLPEYLRVRDGTKVGKKGRTRYTDLRGEDTGRWGDEVKRWKGSGYGNDRRGDGDRAYENVDDRFRPDDDRRAGGPSASGANASKLGERKRRSRSRSNDDRGRDLDGRDSYRPERRRRRSYSRSRSRSRSPRRSRSPPYRSRRSPSPYSDRDREKRRRIDS